MISLNKSSPTISSERNSGGSLNGGNDKQAYKKPHAAFKDNEVWQNATPQIQNSDTLSDNIVVKTEEDVCDSTEQPYVPPDDVQNGTAEALQFIENAALSTLKTVNDKIAENDKLLEDRIHSIDIEKDVKNTIEVKKIKFSRDFEIITDKTTGEQKKKITYKPEIITERISANSFQAQKMKYRVLSHKTGSNFISSSSISQLSQELMQTAQIAAKKGVLHAAVAVSNKVETPLRNYKLLNGTLSAVKNTALAAETLAVTSSEKIVDSTINTMKNKLDESGRDSESYKASKIIVTLTSDIVTDLGTIKKHTKDKFENRFDSKKDFLEKQHDISKDKLEKEKKKAEQAVEKSQQRVENYKPSENVENTNNNLHSIEKNGLKEQTRLKMQDKTTVKTSADKSRVDSKINTDTVQKMPPKRRFVTNTPNGESVVERLIENNRVNNAISQSATTPHKFVVKHKLVKIDGKRVLKFEVSKEELRVRPTKKMFALRAVNSISDIANGRLEFGEKDPTLLSKLSSNAKNRLITRGAVALREEIQKDGGDNDAVRAIDTTITQFQNVGKTYDSAKRVVSSARSSAQSALQPLNNKLENALISTQQKTNSYLSEVRGNRQSLLQPKSSSQKTDFKKAEKKKKNRHHVYVEFRDRETRNALMKKFSEALVKKAKTVVSVGAVFLMIMILPLIIGGGNSGVVSGTLAFGAVTSPTEDIDMTLSEQRWTELAENLIKEFRNFPTTHSGDKYVVADDSVAQLSHDTFKLLAYLSVKCQNDKGVWDYESAKEEIEAIFNEQYELSSEKKVVPCKIVETIENRWEDNMIYEIGTSSFGEYDSAGYTWYAENGYSEICVHSEMSDFVIEDVYILDGAKYDEPTDITVTKVYQIFLDYTYSSGYEFWKDYEKFYSWTDSEFVSYEYGIKEKKSFDTIITERLENFTEEQREMYELYLMFNLAHQSFYAPVKPTSVTDYAGYNTDVNQTDGLDNSITVSTSVGNDVYAPCSGILTKTAETSISIYNPSNQSTIYLEGVIANTTESITKKTVIGKASGDSIKITIKDKDGNYQNPYLFIDWS